MKVKASHGEVYDIPESMEDIFWAFDEFFRDEGLSDDSLDSLGAWDLMFDRFLVEHEQ